MKINFYSKKIYIENNKAQTHMINGIIVQLLEFLDVCLSLAECTSLH